MSLLELMPYSRLDDTPVRYRIPGLLPEHGHVIFSGYAKSGKTTAILHLMKALESGGDFLGRPAERPDGRMVHLNFEMGQRSLRKYATEVGLNMDSRMVLVSNLRGRASAFADLIDPSSDFFEGLAKELRDADCEILFVDPLAPLVAMMGCDSDNNDEVRLVLENLGMLAEQAGIPQLFIGDHTGHGDQGRSRGASAKMDWPDVIWNITGKKAEPRTLDVYGRDVDATQVKFTMDDRHQLVAGDLAAPVTNAVKIRLHLRSQDRTVEELVALGAGSRSGVGKELRAMRDAGEVSKSQRGHADIWHLEGSF